MKVLPALNVEEVECTLDDGEFSIGDFLIEGGDVNWEKNVSVDSHISETNDAVREEEKP